MSIADILLRIWRHHNRPSGLLSCLTRRFVWLARISWDITNNLHHILYKTPQELSNIQRDRAYENGGSVDEYFQVVGEAVVWKPCTESPDDGRVICLSLYLSLKSCP